MTEQRDEVVGHRGNEKHPAIPQGVFRCTTRS